VLDEILLQFLEYGHLHGHVIEEIDEQMIIVVQPGIVCDEE
jgi:hypothetical protein